MTSDFLASTSGVRQIGEAPFGHPLVSSPFGRPLVISQGAAKGGGVGAENFEILRSRFSQKTLDQKCPKHAQTSFGRVLGVIWEEKKNRKFSVASPICMIFPHFCPNFSENTHLWTLLTFHTGRIARCTLHQSIRRELENRLHPFLCDAPHLHPQFFGFVWIFLDLLKFVVKISISAQCKIPNLQSFESSAL